MTDVQLQEKQWLAEKLRPHGIATQVAKATGISLDKLTRSKNLDSSDPKKYRKIQPGELERLARFFNELPPGYEGMTHWLSEDASKIGEAQERVAVRPKPNASFPPVYQRFSGDTSIPLLGRTVGGPNGKFIMNGTEIGRVFCPPGLEGVEGAYALQVMGRSAYPRFKEGETVWINPHLNILPGDDVVAQILSDDEDFPVESYIKEFRSKGNGVLRLWQHNPEPGEPNELEFDLKKVFTVHKVVFHATI